MKKFIKKCGIYISVLFSFIIIYTIICDLVFKENDYYLGSTKRYWQFSLANENYDFVVLGSSRAFGSVNTHNLDSIMNKKSINLGLDGSGFEENYVSLQLFLLNNNHTDALLLQIDPFSFMSEESFSNSFHAYSYLPFWDIDPEIEKILHDEVPVVKDLPFYIPYLPYIIYNNYYSPFYLINSLVSNKEWCENQDYSCINGDKIKLQSNDKNILPIEKLVFKFSKRDLMYYEKIIDLARSNDIKIIGFTAPTLQLFDDNYIQFKNKISPKIFYEPRESWMFDDLFFSDNRHINLAGRDLYTVGFADFLQRNLD